MSTILTDDEIATAIAHLYAGPEVLAMALPDELHSARAIEAAVLAKLAQQEPFAYAVHFPDQQRGELVHDIDELCEDMTNDENHEVTKLYAHPAPQQADRQRVPDGWKVEALSAGDVRVYGPGNETWRLQSNPGQGTFEDFAHRFLSAIAAAPEAPAQASAVDERQPLTDEQILKIMGQVGANATKWTWARAIERAHGIGIAALAQKGGYA